MIQKSCSRCVTNARTIVPICAAINVPRVNRITCFRLCHSVSFLCRFPLNFHLIPNFKLSNSPEILPLVEFMPESDIPEQEVERLLMAPPKPDSMAIDPFVDTIVNEDVMDVLPLTLDRDALRALDPASVLIARWPPPLKTKYLRNLLPELQISICPECLQVIPRVAWWASYPFADLSSVFRYSIRTIWNCRCCRRTIAHFVERIPKNC